MLTIQYLLVRTGPAFGDPDDVLVDVTSQLDQLPSAVQLDILHVASHHQPRSTTTLPPRGALYRRLRLTSPTLQDDLATYGVKNPLGLEQLEYLLFPWRNSPETNLISHFEANRIRT